MAGVGVNQRLAQRSVKAPVYNEDVLEGNGSYDVPKIDIPEGPGSLSQRSSKAPVFNEDVLEGNGSYDIPKIDIPEGPGSLTQMRSIPQPQVLYQTAAQKTNDRKFAYSFDPEVKKAFEK